TPSPRAGSSAQSSSSSSGGGVATSIQATCDAKDGQALISVNFAARAQAGNLSRVRLIDNGAVADDSGPLSQPSYQRIATIKAPFGEKHTLQAMSDIAGGAANAANVSSSIQCSAPPPPPGPRL